MGSPKGVATTVRNPGLIPPDFCVDGPRASGSASVSVGRLVPVLVARVVAGLPRWQATFIALWTALMGAYPARVARACSQEPNTAGWVC